MAMTRKKPKNYPYFSHEFVIQNHADILACLAIFVVIGLMFEKTADISKLFVFLHYGVKNESTSVSEETSYSNFGRGVLDVFNVIFAAVMLVVMHAVFQEYGVERYSKKLHLSKIKTSKFSESAQITIWSFISTTWGIYETCQISFTGGLSNMWKGYPHTKLDWSTKLYFISQIGYWVHMYPELYFQKVKNGELLSRLKYYTLHLAFIAGAYMLHFWRICTFLVTLHSASEAAFHASRIFHYSDKLEYAKFGFLVWHWLFPVVRFITLTFLFLTFFFGLASIENQGVNFLSGSFNSLFIRLVCIGSVSMLQGWLIWHFIHLRLKRAKAEEAEAAAMSLRLAKTQRKSESDDSSSLPNNREKIKSKKNN